VDCVAVRRFSVLALDEEQSVRRTLASALRAEPNVELTVATSPEEAEALAADRIAQSDPFRVLVISPRMCTVGAEVMDRWVPGGQILLSDVGAEPPFLGESTDLDGRVSMLRRPFSETELRSLVLLNGELAVLRSETQVEPSSSVRAAAPDRAPELEATVEAASDFLYLVKPNGKVSFVSAAFERGYGRAPSDWSDAYEEAWKPDSSEDRVRQPFVVELPTEDGKLIQIEVVERRAPAKLGGGFVGTARDITERVILEGELRRARKLAGGIAHDLNDYLTVIGGEADLIADTEQGESARIILETTERASELSRRLMLFGHESSSERVLVDFSELARDAIRLFGRMLPDSINLELDLGARGRILAPPGELSSVLMNLLVNASDAMPGGGTLRVTTVDLESRSTLSVVREGEPVDCIALSVEDTGEGMTSDIRERMFDPFYSTKKAGDGRGLGLALVQGVVQRLGGVTRVYSELCVGTRIDVVLPRDYRAVSDAPRASSSSSGHGELILLVEDDARVRALTRRVLENAGYRVLSMALPLEALEIESSVLGKVAMMVSDVIMPDLSGPELYQKLTQRRPDLRAIFVTGYAAEDLGSEMVEGTGFLRKPWKKDTLLTAVRRCLGHEDLVPPTLGSVFLP